jgi:hypothetical protein
MSRKIATSSQNVGFGDLLSRRRRVGSQGSSAVQSGERTGSIEDETAKGKAAVQCKVVKEPDGSIEDETAKGSRRCALKRAHTCVFPFALHKLLQLGDDSSSI